jgi:hypothetical protein
MIMNYSLDNNRTEHSPSGPEPRHNGNILSQENYKQKHIL